MCEVHLSPKFKRVYVERNSRFSFLGSSDLCRFWFKRLEKSGEYEET